MANGESSRRPGRPRRYFEPRRDIHLSLPERVIEALDAAVGTEGRAAFIERLLREHFGLGEAPQRLSQRSSDT